MGDVMDFVQENWVSITAAATAVLALAGLIAKKTKTTVDDKVVSWLDRILSIFGRRLPQK